MIKIAKPKTSPADLPRRMDQSLSAYEALTKQIRKVEKLPQASVDEIRSGSRRNLMASLTSQWDEMDRDEKPTLAALSKFHRRIAFSGQAHEAGTFDGADATLARLSRKFSLSKDADKLDAARLVTGHRATLIRETAQASGKKKTRLEAVEL